MEEQLLNQFHFYLSDSNLAKDKFLRGKLDESKEGWLHLELFLSFNKIKKVTTNIEDLKNVLSKSTVLELNEDKSMIRRRNPYIEREISSDHVIYAENLSVHWDQDKVREIFQNFGSVTHVSLPKDKQTKEIKGFGFIEFSSSEGAVNALNLNGYQDPSWIQPIVVLSKDEWLHRKRMYTSEHKQIQPVLKKRIPHLLISNLMPDMTSKAIRNFLSMFGPVGYIELYGPDCHPLIKPNTCITQFNSEICTERCIYYLEHYKQYMMNDVPVLVRKLSEDEYSCIKENTNRKREHSGEEGNMKRIK